VIAYGYVEDGAPILAAVEAFLRRFVAYPSDHAAVAVTLWAAHTHVVDRFESSPRLACLSPEPGSGKTRNLEVLDLLVPRPMFTLNASAAGVERVLDHLRRPVPGRGDLLTDDAGNTVSEIDPKFRLLSPSCGGGAINWRECPLVQGESYLYPAWVRYGLGMEQVVAVHLPKPLIQRLDAVASEELRSRANTARWLLDEALRRREPAALVETKKGDSDG
jgi:hypothetical protein